MMDSYITDDFLTLPLVLESTEFQSVGLVNCNALQFEVSKDQSIPLVIFENGDLGVQTDCPLLLPNNFSNDGVFKEEETVLNIHSLPEISCDKTLEVINENTTQTIASYNNNVDFDSSAVLEDDFNNLVEKVITYKCKLCPFKSSDKAALSSHLKLLHLKNLEERDNQITKDNTTKEDLHEQMAYMCGRCSAAYGSFSDWRAHMASVHKIVVSVKTVLENTDLNGGSPIDLDLKKEALKPQKEESKKKYVVPKKEKQMPCPIRSCLVRLSRRDLVEKHKECHAGPRHFACPYCSEPFRKWSDCANHLWSCHSQDVDLYSCPTCDYKTALRTKLEKHVKIHSDEREFMCSECGKTFKQAVQLKNHRVCHLKAADSPNLPNWSKKQVCPQCKRSFYDGKALKKHIQSVHSNLRPYVCQVCGHTSANKNRMGLHLRQHTGEKPFSCPLCSFTTGDQNCLRRHAWRHSHVRPYTCPHCTYSCIQSNSLKKHIKAQHPGASGVLTCKDCSFTSLSQASLESHIAKAHDSKNDDKFSEIVCIEDIGSGDSMNGSGQVIQLPLVVATDDESQNCFEVPVVDTGGITIPADQGSQ